MARRKSQAPPEESSTPVATPPGATRRAWDRPVEPEGGLPGSGAGPRHASNDIGSEMETYDDLDDTRTLASPPEDAESPLEQGPPFAGRSGGAVGGTPAQKRSKLNAPPNPPPPDEPDPVPPRMGPSGLNTLRLTGFDAIEYAEKQTLLLNKHPDGITGPRVGLTVAEAQAVAADDPDLVWLDVSVEEYYEGLPTSFEPSR
jgi:hypothetical protein